MNEPAFELRWDGAGTRQHPDGYWHARTVDGNWDAVGSTPLAALANLVTELHKALAERTNG